METTQPATPTPGLSPDPSQSQPLTASSGASADEQDDEMFNSPWIRAAVRQRMAVQPPGGRLESGQQGEISQFVNTIGERAAQAVVDAPAKAVSLAKGAMGASEGLRTTGEYSPAPVVEAASMAVAPGAVLARRAAGAGAGQMAGDAMSGLGLAFGAQDAASEHDLSSLVPAVAGAAMPAIAGPMRAAGQTAARVMARNPIKTAAGIGGAAALAPGAAEAGPAREEAGALARREQPSPMGGAVDAGMELTGAPGSIRDKAPEPSQEEREPPSPRKQVAGGIPTSDTADKPAWARPLEEKAYIPIRDPATPLDQIQVDESKWKGPGEYTSQQAMGRARPEPYMRPQRPATSVTVDKKTGQRTVSKVDPKEWEADQVRAEAAREKEIKAWDDEDKKNREAFQKSAEAQKGAWVAHQKSLAKEEALEKKRKAQETLREKYPIATTALAVGTPEIFSAGLKYADRMRQLMAQNKRVRLMLESVAESKEALPEITKKMAAGEHGALAATEGEIERLSKSQKIDFPTDLASPPKKESLREIVNRNKPMGLTTMGIGIAPDIVEAVWPEDRDYPSEPTTDKEKLLKTLKLAGLAGLGFGGGVAGGKIGEMLPMALRAQDPTQGRLSADALLKTYKGLIKERDAVKKAAAAAPAAKSMEVPDAPKPASAAAPKQAPAAAPKPAPAAKSKAAPEAAPDAKDDQFNKLMQLQRKQRVAVAKANATASGQPAPKRSKAVGEDD